MTIAKDAPIVGGLHLQFGADASTEVVVSWHTPAPVSRPQVVFGTAEDGLGQTTAAETITYRDAASGQAVYAHHATITGLWPPTLDASVARAFGRDNLGSPAAGDITTAVEHAAPLFNLVNGDLCYANLAHDRVGTWSAWFENNTRSARYRPWMPAAGNHENELGNGPVGCHAYQT